MQRSDSNRELLEEQITYYRARAPEYDEWVERRGMFDYGPEWKAQWDTETAEVAAALDRFAPGGRVLELACGTGWWTQRLAQHASELVCVDASPEAVGIARTRAPNARFVIADLFEWEPDERYDVVFFSFWLSHVPAERFEWFWSVVDRALEPGGRVFVIDNKTPLPSKINRRGVQTPTDEEGVVLRKLNDGRTFRAVKIYYEPHELVGRLAALGWRLEVATTEQAFYYAWGARG